jgi:hypothetical protein
MTTYTVTASTPDRETVFLDTAPNGWLVMTRTPVQHMHGPKLRDVVWSAVMDPHLTHVEVHAQEEGTPE